MSRSRKKQAICGITSAESEKKDKVSTHRKLRKTEKTLCAMSNIEIIDDVIFPKKQEVSNKYLYAKDGKQKISKKSEYYKKCLRK